LLVTALSAFWLGEKVGWRRWSAIFVGFLGIVVVTRPLGQDNPALPMIEVGRFAAMVSVFCYSLSIIMVRRMRLGETNITFSFYGYCSSALIGGVLLLLRGGTVLQMHDILHLALSGTLGGIASICLMSAYHRTPVALVAPFQYTQIIWGALAGYFLWDHVPDIHLVLGASIVACSGLFVIYRELKLKEAKTG
jgi:drug/metabolite transporter (DMT)-like permease